MIMMMLTLNCFLFHALELHVLKKVCRRRCGRHSRERAHDVDVLMQQTLKVRQRHIYRGAILKCSVFSLIPFAGYKKVHRR